MTKKSSEGKQPSVWLRFSSVGLQMGIVIALGAYGGQWLDNHYQKEFPLFTLILSLLGVGVGLYMVIKEVINMSKDN
ncbi:MAG: F0F1-type ATP synthase assembly protein I [Candidatus Azotimanducaceae bacterium]|jgi:F0F1-type ATP synthase assembly protein I